MKDFISNIDLALWIALITGQVILCLCIFKKDVLRRLPWFSVYILASTVKSIVFLFLAFFASYAVYYYGFYVVSHLISVLAFLTLIEFARRALPGLDLPRKEKAVVSLVAILSAVFVFVALWPLKYLENRIEIGSYLAVAVAFGFIAGYSRYLGLYWSRLVGGVSLTLGVLYLVDGAAKAVMSHYPHPIFLPVRHISEVVSIAATVAWIIVILSPWGVRNLTEEDLLKLEQLIDHMETDFIAAVRKAKFITGGDK
jgi:hypothetical protein